MGLREIAQLSLLALGVAGVFASSSSGSPPQERLSFSRDILPILSDKCFKCHGPDAGSRAADLRLDTAEGAFADRGGRWAIVPGQPEKSLLVQRINHPQNPMPPASSDKSLSGREKEILTRWIAEGARYSKLWSFEPLPESVPVPRLASLWPKDDIDRFVLDRLNRAGLRPSAPASRERWLRRVTLDLTGRPPTEAEIDAFLDDRGPEAFETVVERLLASPHFGERMAVEWLDVARYADSYGYQSDLLMPSWPYRDWVVRAFNENLSYDQFITWQIAGDLFPNATRDQRLATAFNRLHRQSNEGGSIALEFKTEYAADRTDTYGTAFLGLTLGCARCHDHKFDPITQKEYYQLFGYFNSIDEFGLLLSTEIVPTPSLLLPSAEQEKRLAELRKDRDRAIVERVRLLRSRMETNFGGGPLAFPLRGAYRFSLDEAGDRFASADASGRPSEGPELTKVFAQPIGKLERIDGSKGKAVRFDGETGLVVRGAKARERWDPFSWAFWVRDPRSKGPVVLLHRTGGTDVGFCGFDLTLEDGFLTARIMRHWPGNAVAVRTRKRLPMGEWTHIGWTWDGFGTAEGLQLYVGGKPAATEVLNDRLWKKVHAYGDLGPSGNDWAFGQRFRDAGFKYGAVDDLVYADRELSAHEMTRLVEAPVYDRQAAEHDAQRSVQVQKVEEEIRNLERQIAELEEQIPEVSVMEEAKPEIPAYLLARGEYDAPRNESTRVERGTPASLPPSRPGRKNDRLALAEWTVDPDHPLTARVAVNRYWQMLFGSGLVDTSENFGAQGSHPSHPELLDYLAREFVNGRWDVKKLLKRIVLSATYRQDSARTKGQLKDPANRLFARGPSGRLSAEMVRDLALAGSGLLIDKLGGPPVNPYQPAGIWQEFNTMSPAYVQSKGADLYRRSLYSTWKRTTPVPSMLTFDATSREACITRRAATSTPLQALVLLNDVQYVEAARALAESVLSSPSSWSEAREVGGQGGGSSANQDIHRLTSAFRRLAGRSPIPTELDTLLDTLADQRVHFRKNVAAAGRLIETGDSEPNPKLRPSELAAWTVTVQTILNSDAVIWKR